MRFIYPTVNVSGITLYIVESHGEVLAPPNDPGKNALNRILKMMSCERSDFETREYATVLTLNESEIQFLLDLSVDQNRARATTMQDLRTASNSLSIPDRSELARGMLKSVLRNINNSEVECDKCGRGEFVDWHQHKSHQAIQAAILRLEKFTEHWENATFTLDR